MPITQFFFRGKSNIRIFDTENSEELTCQNTINDQITWEDAEVLTNSFKQFSSTLELGENLSFILEEAEIAKVFEKLPTGSQKAVRIYLAYCNTDKTIRAFGVGAAFNNASKEYDDLNVPETMLGSGTSIQTDVPIANTRPCPPQCGTINVLNRPLP